MAGEDTKRFDTPDEIDASETRQLLPPVEVDGTKMLVTAGGLIPKRLRVIMPDKSELVFDSLSPHLTVGRSSTVNTRRIDIDMEIYDKGYFGVSRFHAMIIPDNQHGLVIKDMQSTNGTYINGKKLRANENYPLADGDFVKFGNLKVQLFFELGK
ncbi:MAG: FHA domain-containing protein [Anaerolineae bacterium]|nr:FHA domain-containing protein [Anaerolineae bacterium]